METLGQILKTARERKRISLSQAAAKTRVKLQHLEMMERDDFSRMPAPAYAKGFIRIYADFLGLDSGPLVREYVDRHAGKGRAGPDDRATPPPAEVVPDAGEAPPADAPAAGSGAFVRRALGFLSPERVKALVGVTLVLLLAWGLVRGVSRCARRLGDSGPDKTLSFRKGVPAVIEEPAEPYLDVSKGESP